jgi:CRP-like cAMP-binding protein
MLPPERGLAQTPLFAGLPEAALAEINRLASKQRLEKDTYIFQQGEEADFLHIVTQGRVRLLQITPDGQQVVLRVAGPWQSFSVLAVLEGARYPVTAQAVEESRLLYWSGDTLRALIDRYPRIALNGMAVLARQVQDFQDRYREMVTERVERRVARALLRLAQQLGRKTPEGVLIDLALSRQDLAEMTGTTLYTVSRIFSQWEGQGLVEAGRERIVVKFPHGLVHIAEDLPGPPGPETHSD